MYLVFVPCSWHIALQNDECLWCPWGARSTPPLPSELAPHINYLTVLSAFLSPVNKLFYLTRGHGKQLVRSVVAILDFHSRLVTEQGTQPLMWGLYNPRRSVQK